MSHSIAPTAITPAARPPLATYLLSVAQEFRNAEREGAEIDDPEGARYVKISETALDHIIEELEFVAKAADPFKLEDEPFYRYSNAIAEEWRRRLAKRNAQRVVLK